MCIRDRSRDYAYSNSLPAIEQVLAENPTIEVVIDLHRDEVLEGRKLVMDLNGKQTAQFMFFNGLSYTKAHGDIDYLQNPYIDENLSLIHILQRPCGKGTLFKRNRTAYFKAYVRRLHIQLRHSPV